MTNLVHFPYRNKVYTYDQPTKDDKYIVCTFSSPWPEFGIQVGQRGLIRCGFTFPKQLILIRLRYRCIICLLLYRDVDENISICGSSGRVFDYRKGEYRILGNLVEVFRGPHAIRRPLVEIPLLTNGHVLSWKNDERGNNLKATPEWTRLTGQSVEATRHLGWLNVVHPDERDGIIRKRDDGMKRGEPYQLLYHVRQASGTYVQLLALVAPIISTVDEIVGWTGAAQIQNLV